MKQTLILLAGYPGTGKSYLAELLMKQFTGFEILSPDEIKEEFWDAYGFRNEQEKEELIQKSWVEYYHRMEWKFTRGISLLSDYPFSHKQHDRSDTGKPCMECETSALCSSTHTHYPGI